MTINKNESHLFTATLLGKQFQIQHTDSGCINAKLPRLDNRKSKDKLVCQ
jgi:hypothetical protein